MTVTHLTTALQSNASTNFVQANANFFGTNASGTIASNGISVSVNAGGAGDGVNIIGVNGNSVGSNATIQFSNSNNVTFGLNGSTVTASASYPAQTAFVFSNANGVSFGTNGSTVTATVATNYQSQGAYLTTAALSQDSSKYAGINGAITGGSLTVNTSGVSINLPAYLTTAMASNAGSNFAGLGETVTTTAGTDLKMTVNSQGVNIAHPVWLTTAQPVGAYLTTARASTDAIGLNSAITANGVSMTANSSGLSLNFPAFLTTAMQSASSSVFAKTGFTTASTAGTDIVGTLNTNGLSMGIPKYITTYAAGGGDAIRGIAVAGATLTTNTVNFSNSNGISFGLGAGGNSTVMTASHNAITTGALSDHSHGNPTLALTNLSGTTASASNGFTLSLSAAAPGAGAAVTVSASNGSFTVGQLNFSNANNVTFGTSAGSIVTASVAAPGGGAANTFYSTVIGLENAWAQSSSSLGQNSLYIQPHNLQANVSAIALKVPVLITNSSIGSSSGRVNYTALFGIYTRNATNSTVLTLHYSTSYTLNVSNSSNASRAYSVITGIGNSTSYNTVTSSSAGLNLSSNIHGPREFIMPISSLLTPGAYWFAWKASSALSGTSNSVFALSHIIYSSQTNAPLHGATSATSFGGLAKNIGLGTYSTTTGALPNGISITQINKAATQPVFYIVNETS